MTLISAYIDLFIRGKVRGEMSGYRTGERILLSIFLSLQNIFALLFPDLTKQLHVLSINSDF